MSDAANEDVDVTKLLPAGPRTRDSGSDDEFHDAQDQTASYAPSEAGEPADQQEHANGAEQTTEEQGKEDAPASDQPVQQADDKDESEPKQNEEHDEASSEQEEAGEGSAVDVDSGSEAEEGDEQEQEEVQKEKPKPRQAFDVPSAGHPAWGHDDRFDEAEAKAHEAKLQKLREEQKEKAQTGSGGKWEHDKFLTMDNEEPVDSYWGQNLRKTRGFGRGRRQGGGRGRQGGQTEEVGSADWEGEQQPTQAPAQRPPPRKPSQPAAPQAEDFPPLPSQAAPAAGRGGRGARGRGGRGAPPPATIPSWADDEDVPAPAQPSSVFERGGRGQRGRGRGRGRGAPPPLPAWADDDDFPPPGIGGGRGGRGAGRGESARGGRRGGSSVASGGRGSGRGSIPSTPSPPPGTDAPSGPRRYSQMTGRGGGAAGAHGPRAEDDGHGKGLSAAAREYAPVPGAAVRKGREGQAPAGVAQQPLLSVGAPAFSPQPEAAASTGSVPNMDVNLLMGQLQTLMSQVQSMQPNPQVLGTWMQQAMASAMAQGQTQDQAFHTVQAYLQEQQYMQFAAAQAQQQMQAPPLPDPASIYAQQQLPSQPQQQEAGSRRYSARQG